MRRAEDHLPGERELRYRTAKNLSISFFEHFCDTNHLNWNHFATPRPGAAEWITNLSCRDLTDDSILECYHPLNHALQVGGPLLSAKFVEIFEIFSFILFKTLKSFPNKFFHKLQTMTRIRKKFLSKSDF